MRATHRRRPHVPHGAGHQPPQLGHHHLEHHRTGEPPAFHRQRPGAVQELLVPHRGPGHRQGRPAQRRGAGPPGYAAAHKYTPAPALKQKCVGAGAGVRLGRWSERYRLSLPSLSRPWCKPQATPPFCEGALADVSGRSVVAAVGGLNFCRSGEMQ